MLLIKLFYTIITQCVIKKTASVYERTDAGFYVNSLKNVFTIFC